MAIAPLALKVLGGSIAAVGTAGAGYLVWDNFINTGLTEHDNFLISKSEEFKKLSWGADNNGTSTTTTEETGAPQLKLTLKTNDGDSSKKVGLTLEIKSKDDGQKILKDSKLKTWTCTIEQDNKTKVDLSVEEGSQIAKLKKSFGIGASPAKITDSHWKSIKTFMERCAYEGSRNNLVNNEALTRTIKLKTKSSQNNKHEFIGLDKFFIK